MSENTTNEVLFGKPNYSSSKFSISKIWRLKDGDNVYRILPPMKSLKETGEWRVRHKVHFGYMGVDSKDPTKLRHRPFACVRQYNRDGTVSVECPECVKREKTQALLEEKIKVARASNTPPKDIKMLVAPLQEWLSKHTLDRKWYMNVKTANGEFGVLAIPQTAKLSLDNRIDKVRKDGIEPISVNSGVWFEIQRNRDPDSGRYNFPVDVVYENITVNGTIAKAVKKAALSEVEQKQAHEKCADLPLITRSLTLDQIGMLVNGSGDPKEVDEVFGIPKQNFDFPPITMEESPDTETNNNISVVTKTLAPMPVVLTVDDNRQLQVPMSSPVPVRSSSNFPKDISQMSDEDFIKLFTKSK